MKVQSIKVVRYQILKLFDNPFNVSKFLQRQFYPIFKDEKCFRKSSSTIPSKEVCKFMKNIGEIRWDSSADHTPRLGNLEDQRMEITFFYLKKGISIRATLNSKIYANGRIFIHVYPSGYIILILDIRINKLEGNNSFDLSSLLINTDPEEDSRRWTWTCSKLKEEGSLEEIVENIRHLIIQSFFGRLIPLIAVSSWQSFYRVVSHSEAEEITNEIWRPDIDYVSIHLIQSDGFFFYKDFIVIFKPSVRKKDVSNLSIQYMKLYEYCMLKDFILSNTDVVLKNEIEKMENQRRSIFCFNLTLSMHKPKIPKYLGSFEKPLCRKYYRLVDKDIFMKFEQHFELTEQMNRVKKTVEDWKKELNQWKPCLYRYYELLKTIGSAGGLLALISWILSLF